MTAIPDHYAALGIDPTADQEVIAAAYRALAKKYHPDTGATTGTASAERFAEIQQAYEVLGSTEGRRRYDEELLEATQRELDEHLAKKQRKIAGATGEPPPPPPDLGVIRPQRAAGKPVKLNVRSSLREMGPFLVVSGLLMAVGVGFASLLLRQAPPPPVEEAVLPEPPQRIEEPAPAKPAEPAQPASTPAPQPSPAPQQQAALPDEKPLFGTSMMDEPAETVPPPAANEEAAAPAEATAPDAVPVPVPKAKPQTAAAPETDTVAETRGSARFAVVIYEKYRTGDVIEDQARLVFSSEDRCAAFGERAVLRRLAPYEGQRQRPRIWYECNEIP